MPSSLFAYILFSSLFSPLFFLLCFFSSLLSLSLFSVTLLLPYLISGLSDDQPTIRSLCLSVTDEMGQEYESDHKEDLKDRLYYGAKLEQAQGKHALLPEPFTCE